MKRLLAFCLFAFLSAAVFAEDGFVSLMPTQSGLTWTQDGQAQNGWVKYGGGATFEFDGEKITGKRGPGGNTFLCTEKKYLNFVFKGEVKYEVHCNSGIQFRSNVRKDKHGDHEHSIVYGYQYEIDTNGNAGQIYDESRRGRWVEPVPAEINEKVKNGILKIMCSQLQGCCEF